MITWPVHVYTYTSHTVVLYELIKSCELFIRISQALALC